MRRKWIINIAVEISEREDRKQENKPNCFFKGY